MSDYSYNLWKLHELTSSDPRMYLDIIVTNAGYNKILRMFVITLRLKFKKTEIRKIIFRSKWRCIKGAKSPKNYP